MQFKSEQRVNDIEALKNTEFDVVIIGGGITGAGIALQSAASGLKTAIIDMQDFSEGTSSRSTKLVHGGIRYLKTFDIDVVADTVGERARVQKIAPHIPRPSHMMMPLYNEPEATFTPLSAEIAMEIYDKLAAVPRNSPFVHRLLSSEEANDYLPMLNQEGLDGLAIYLDFQNNDARLTIENIKQAASDGAVAVSHLKALQISDSGDDKKVHVQDNMTNEIFDITGKIVINAAGPWHDTITKIADEETTDSIRPTKGVHLVVNQDRLPVPNTLYFDSGFHDGRMIFVIPRADKTYFGTTDTDYHGDYSHPKVEQEDVDYLLTAINHRFPNANITLDDIQASWAGLRPLIGTGDYNGNTQKKKVSDEALHELDDTLDQYFDNKVDRKAVDAELSQLNGGAKSASSVSRGYKIKVENDIVNVSGGKITDYRLMASDTMKEVAKILRDKFNQEAKLVDSTNYPVSGGHFDPTHVDEAIAEFAKDLEAVGVTPQEAQEIADFYGSNTAELIEYIKTGEAAPHLSVTETSMLHYAIDKEFVLRPIDFFLRRTNYLLFKSEDLPRLETPVIDEMARYLDWSDETKAAMRQEYEQLRDEAQLKALKEEAE
ncbi:glycerol-3-phosphate dehydrogenase [Weissella uvarum]|uniref:FAD-dependent oxidoreductase n=1 Tax=Weissella uvarum TaxID=1479233 RepID=UPI001960F915|nr:FAD-dependent oxidoreductase [Weissella uvarum]MBM7616576.1 glycerol-3-phosphate dehydrogenase [Weissella uvarum]MCM0594964.1 FAD-dependent oxidoreductase [Weissella uvarum]